ncbi:iron uptake porin [Phormidesmis sp. 146-35]
MSVNQGRAVVTNSFGVQASFRPSSALIINGWVGYTGARVLRLGDANIWNWAVTLGFPDLGKKGNLAGLVIGMEPKLTQIDGAVTAATGVGRDRDTSLHLTAFYQYRVNDNLSITPGVIWLTAPNHDQRNQDLVIGTIRTTFTF